MKCPYCSHEMRLGYLNNATQPIDWIPEGEKPSIWKAKHAPKGVPIKGSGSYWKGFQAVAYYCVGCRVVIAQTET